MAYDILAESRRLIIEGPPAQQVRLSRRRRFAALAVDVDGDIAAARCRHATARAASSRP
jgi:hypothetical protein